MMHRGLLCLVMLIVAVGWSVGVEEAAAQAVAATRDVEIDGEYGYGLPPDVSEHGAGIDQLIYVVHWFMGLLFVGWGVFFVFCLVKFRQRPEQQADPVPIKAKASEWLEIGVAVFEAVLLLGFSMPLWAQSKNAIPPLDDTNAVRVRVVAEQFAWNFHYAGPDGLFGRTAVEHIDMESNLIGIDPDDPNGADDVVSGELHFPVGRPIVTLLSSKDVIHSFAIPVMRVKQDVIPGMRIPTWFQAKTTGTYEIACAQLCGNNHYSMRALMVIEESDEAFNAWVESERPEEFDEEEFD